MTIGHASECNTRHRAIPLACHTSNPRWAIETAVTKPNCRRPKEEQMPLSHLEMGRHRLVLSDPQHANME